MQEITAYIQKKLNENNDYLDFKDKDSSHKYHTYPATMIPELPDLFIKSACKGQSVNMILDPFLGSGTTLMMAQQNNINSVGIDINPLACLISRVETTKLNQALLEETFAKLISRINQDTTIYPIPDYKNITYWFSNTVIQKLSKIKYSIKTIKDKQLQDFFLVAFSETVHYCSYSRNSEFKLYRMPEKTMKQWQPDVIKYFIDKCTQNIYYNKDLKNNLKTAKIIKGSAKDMPLDDDSVDLVITSPPYGDSKTTVAYGQFSKLSLQWLDLPYKEASSLDKNMLGGHKIINKLSKTPSKTLNNSLVQLAELDVKRSLEVLQFYLDLFKTIKECKRVAKPNSYQFWVTANRTVKGIQLPTNIIISELFKAINVEYVVEYKRNIPNKRIPYKNSPTNQRGAKQDTMNIEHITVFKVDK